MQRADGLIACPACGEGNISKALSVPNIGRKGNQPVAAVTAAMPEATPVDGEVINTPALPPVMMEMMQKMASAQSEMLKSSEWVGREFAETARSIHYGESDDRLIHGETSRGEAQALLEEGIAVAALPFPVIPPAAKN